MRAEYDIIEAGSALSTDKVANGNDTMVLAGIAVENASGDAVIAHLADALERGALTRLAFLNAHCVNVSRGDEEYRDALRRCTVLPDGVGVDLGAKIIYGRPFVENLNGTDFVPRLLKALERPLNVALVGGAPGIADKAAAALTRRSPIHRFVAVSDGYFRETGRDALLSRLEEGGFDIVLVAMGVPQQELFLARHLDHRHGRLLIGVGALFDFLAGNVQRAPIAVRKLRLEWVWRLGLEPGRLWRRYVVGNPKFVLGMARDRLIPSDK